MVSAISHRIRASYGNFAQHSHANVSVTMNTYVQAVTPAKRKAQRGIIKQIREVAPDGPDSNLKCLQVLEMVGAIGFEPMTSTV